MRRTVVERFDGWVAIDKDTTGYRTTKVFYKWKYEEELVHRYIKHYHPNLYPALLRPYREMGNGFGLWVEVPKAGQITFKTKCAYFISYDDMENTYRFETSMQKRWALKQIVLCLTEWYALKEQVTGRVKKLQNGSNKPK